MYLQPLLALIYCDRFYFQHCIEYILNERQSKGPGRAVALLLEFEAVDTIGNVDRENQSQIDIRSFRRPNTETNR